VKLRKVFKGKGLGPDFGRKLFVAMDPGKVFISDEKDRVSLFRGYFNCTGLEGETYHEYLVDMIGFRWLWGLTCDFWAEFGEK
jgi:hypothetical protein